MPNFVRAFYPQARVDLGLIPVDSTASAENLINLGALRPISLEVSHESIRSADTFRVSIAEDRFPIDPRLVRSAVCDIHLADVGGIDKLLDTDSPDSRVILGNADRVKKTYGSDGDVAVFEGRDYKGLLLDEDWQGRSPKLGRPIDVIVREVLASIPATSALEVVSRLDGPAPVVPAGVGRKRGVFRADADTPLLEALVTLALSVGVIVTVEHDRVVIQPPRTYSPKTARTPYFALAKNLEKLEVERVFGTKDLPNIRVRAYDPATGSLVTGQYPATFERQPKATKAKSQKKRTTTTNIREYPIKHAAPTKPKLDAIAKQIFDRFSQQQLTLSFTTRDLRVETNQSTPDFPDVVSVSQLRNGGAIRIRLEPGERQILEKALTKDQQDRELRALGYSDELARVLSRNWRILDTPLFIDRATHSFDADSGYEFDAEASAFTTVDL